ncbi:MAG: glycerol-3-phosphate 1-O-acyltransferase PlsY [Rikenellaceae bacterium]|nr:glycerol-3-phosphate 1-O-acyltransferase PlsY [Rikenellaceae bacterium]MCL2692087.1 glycerol-3-phosphate 1-O-acyltransferase PlsY [Rikenellaceae bacterium]
MVVYALLLIAAYLLGSISSAVWIGRQFYGIDIREHGSRNAGATNILRVLGKRAAIPVFAIDSAKGFAAVKLYLLAPTGDEEWQFYFKLALCAAVVAGHIFPIFTGFKGGKGVATLAGAVLAINTPAVLLCLGTFLIVLAIWNYVSLGSVVAGIMYPVYTYIVCRLWYPQVLVEETVFALVVAVALIIMHRKNLRRIATGAESKIYYFPEKARKKREEARRK